MTTRRSFCLSSLAALAHAASAQLPTGAEPHPLEPWRSGYLDLHHISTGRGNSMLAICPDGTTLLFDAGAQRGDSTTMGPAQPSAAHRPGEWIAHYVLHHLRTAPRAELDFLVLSHFHGDHMGDLLPDSPLAAAGGYRLTGVSDVAERVPVHTLIDRAYPDYIYPAPSTYDGTLNYIQFARSAAQRGIRVERLQPGSSRQIALQRTPAAFPGFTIRNLAANGQVWTGHGDDTQSLFPPLATLQPDNYPSENACSIALRFTYGSFSYYIGGDLTADTRFGTAPWMDVESAVARAAGPVTVSALDHHGYFDATGEQFVRRMRSRVYIAQTWHASHPALPVIDRLYSPLLYPGPRDVLATGLVPAASLANDRYANRMLSRQGHIVVRVAPSGTFELLILDDTVERGMVKASFGPYTA